MATENERVPPSPEISASETEVDPQVSACANDGNQEYPSPNQGVPHAQAPEGRQSVADQAHADVRFSTASLTIGHLLGGRYRIERELGEGGMGAVYLVADEQVCGERFAIKVLKEELNPEALMLLREEVRKTRRLSHPNIIDVHSVNLDGRWLYVLMEYLEGKSLDTLLEEEFGRGMSFSRASPIIEDVGAALGNAHDHNVIHSDLKPANVFVTTAGRTKLLDFGIARASRARWGLRALTPAYASCEMLEGKEADRRDDIYSFACMIYEMLCGDRPFGELTALEAREAGAKVPPLEGLSRKQNAALAQGLAFDRDRRTSSVEELIDALAADHKPGRRPIVVLGAAIITAVAAVGLTYLVLHNRWVARQSVMVQSAVSGAQTVTSAPGAIVDFNPPPHSIAVLPFVNMSGDKDQEYFSDGLAEELLNSLSRINGLHVVARTSAFSFKGKDTDIGTIARKLNVGAVLEGSVRRSMRTVRVNTQLINPVTGYQLWSATYDRDLGDVLKLQTEISTAVASALKVTLLGDEAARIELGGTRNPEAFDAYLRASKAANAGQGASSYQTAIAAYAQAMRLDPNYALAFAGRSLALSNYAGEFATESDIGELLAKAQADARAALKLAPELAEGHLALARFLFNSPLDFTHANEAYERAMALAPGNAEVLAESGLFAVAMGRFGAGLASVRQAIALDPLNPRRRAQLGEALHWARRYQEAIAAFGEVISLEPDFKRAYGFRGVGYYWLGDYQSARSSCETKPDHWSSLWCLALTYEKLGRHVDAQAALKGMQTAFGDASAYQIATIYAQWGNTAKALDWLVRAVQLPDPGVGHVKTDPLLDPVRNEPRFQAIERALKFPD